MLEPQITGGVEPPGFVTENVSVRHRVDNATGIAAGNAKFDRAPLSRFPMETVEVDGPAIAKV